MMDTYYFMQMQARIEACSEINAIVPPSRSLEFPWIPPLGPWNSRFFEEIDQGSH